MNTLRFEDVDIHCFNDEGKLWFCGRDILTALEYSTSNVSKILSKISSINKKSLSELVQDATHNEGQFVYIDEFGLLKFVLTSKKPRALDFEQFLEMCINNIKYTAIQSFKSINTNLSSQLAITKKSNEEMIKQLQAEHTNQIALLDKKHRYQVEDAVATVLEESVASKRKRIRRMAEANHNLNEQICRLKRVGCASCKVNTKVAMDTMREMQQANAELEFLYETIEADSCGCIDTEALRQKAARTRF